MVDKVEVKKGEKKKFFEVIAPLTASKIHLYSSSAEELDGRTVKLDLTKILRGKNFELQFKIKKNGEVLEGIPIRLFLVGSYIRRVIGNGTDYVEDSFVTGCRDYDVKIKPFMITRHKVSREVRKALRNTAKDNLTSYVKIRTAEELFSDIMANKLQKQLSLRLRKIYPLALCEIRMFEIIGKKKEEAKKEEKAEEKIEVKEEAKTEKKEKAEEQKEEKPKKARAKKSEEKEGKKEQF